MADQEQIVVQQIKDVTVATFHASRILDAAQVEALGEELYALVDRKDRRKLILDFTEVRFLSSAMLGVLLNLRNKADRVRGRIVLCGLRAELHKVFRITKIDKLFDFFDTEGQALTSFGITGVP